MYQETKIVKIYNEKYNKYWSCTLKSYKNTWSQNGWVLVGMDEFERPISKEVKPPAKKEKKKSFFKKVLSKIFPKK